MKRKYFFLIIMLLGAVYFTNGRPTEIAERIMVHAIGIDKESYGYKVTMQTFTPGASGSETSIDPSEPNVSIVNGSGATVTDAVRGCYSKLGGNVFIGQNQIIIFGHDIDLSQKEDIFGFFLSSSESFLNVDCAAAENTAEEILNIPISGSTVTSEKYPQMIESAAENGRCIKTDFMQLLCGMESHDQSVILPVFSKTSASEKKENEQSSGGSGGESQELQEAELQIKNGALFVNGKFSAEITYEQMGIAGLLGGGGKYVHTELRSDDRDYSKTYRLRSREVTSEISDGEIIFHINCRVSPKDSEMFSESSQRDESNRIATELIEKKSQSFAEDVCEKFTPELLGADAYIKRFYPRLYAKYADDPKPLYDHIRFEINIE